MVLYKDSTRTGGTPMAQKAQSLFRHPWWLPYSDFAVPAKCLDEWLIIHLSSQIREKPDWEEKYKNPEIVAKWRAEFASLGVTSTHKDAIFDYTLQELAWYEKLQNSTPQLKTTAFKFGPEDRIVYSDNSIGSETATAFARDAAAFEKDSPKDYHPGSDDLVVDLVHPSLYHLVYDRTREIVDGKLVEAKFSADVQDFKKNVSDLGVSTKFQWLPASMKKDSSGKFSFASYINNLHPIQYKGLYDSIGAVFNDVLPGLNLTLARYLSPNYVRLKIPDYTDAYNDKFSEYEEKLDQLYEEEYNEEKEEKLMAERANYLREIPPKWENEPTTTPFDLRDFDKLKVIVKMANIELTPEKPSYKGGSWHVEGTINEDIVATVLYYYDMENIEDSKLSFRTAYDDPRYEQGDLLYCEHFFGINDGDKMTKQIGSVTAKQGRVIIFPNALQHHVDAFELADKLKPGFRKILCFFVVDPYNHLVRSTETVPPQQELWVQDAEIMKSYAIDPKDVTTMTEEEAHKIRKDLMDERSAASPEDSDDWDNVYTREFSLCEH